GINSHCLFNFRKTCFERRSKRSRSKRNMHCPSVPACPLNHPYDPVRLLIEPVKTQFIHYIEGDKPAGGQANSQPRDIDKRINLLTFQVSESKPEVVAEHKMKLINVSAYPAFQCSANKIPG